MVVRKAVRRRPACKLCGIGRLALECLPYTSRRRQRRLARAVRDLWVARCACLCRWSPSGPFGGWARDDRRACRPHAPPLSLSRTIACHCIVRRPDALVWTCTPDAASCFTSPRLLRKAQKPAQACDQQIAPTASPPPRLPPRMPPVVSQYTHRRCGAGGWLWRSSLVQTSRWVAALWVVVHAHAWL